MTAEEEVRLERLRTVLLLRDKALAAEPNVCSWPIWLHFLWGLFHPRLFGEQYGRFMALSEAADAIERGEHNG